MKRFEIDEISQISIIRRYLQDITVSLRFHESTIGNAAIIISEMGTNLIKFAIEGEILIQTISRGDCTGLEIISIDKGPGIENINVCLQDGWSRAGSQGTGLGAMVRLSSETEYYSLPGKGTVWVSRIFEGTVPPDCDPLKTSVISIPLKGEIVNGDGWAKNITTDRSRFLLVDGLGHGPHAHEAAQGAIESFEENPRGTIEECLSRMHLALRSTRGAAASLLEIVHESGEIQYAGVGNVSGSIVTPKSCVNLTSLPGTLGAEVQNITLFSYSSGMGSDPTTHVVMTSDGITSKWNMDPYPGLFHKDPTIIASVIYRDFHRKNDDCSVMVIRKNMEV